ncbi:MAG: ATP-binding protein [Acidobacteriota bacterium]
MSLRRRLALAFAVILGLFALNLGVSRWSDGQRTTHFGALESALEAQLLVEELVSEVEARRLEVLGVETFDAVGQGASREQIEDMAARLRATGDKTRRLQELVRAAAAAPDADESLQESEADAATMVLGWSRLEAAWAPVYAGRLDDGLGDASSAPPADAEGAGAPPSETASVSSAEDQSAQIQSAENQSAGDEPAGAEPAGAEPTPVGASAPRADEARQSELRVSVHEALERLAAVQRTRVTAATRAFHRTRSLTERITAGTFFVSLLFAVLVAIAVSTQLNSGLRRLRRGAQRIGDGELDHRIPVRAAEGGDELDELAHELNDMADKLRDAHEKLDEARAAAVDASQAKSAFLANMSHELRTPMNAILGYTEMLLEDAHESRGGAARELEKILGAGRHLRALIDDVLDLSKIEAGKTTLFLEEIDLHQVLDEVLATTEPLIAEHSNELMIDAPEDLGIVRVDATKLRQILLNLLSNAAKFTDRGTVTLRARRQREASGTGERIRLEVADTGIGMSDEQLERIFDPFTQADASTTRRYGGTGLGLAIAREHCRLMAGSLTATSAEGEGSRFVVDLPTIVDRAPEATTATAALPVAG